MASTRLYQHIFFRALRISPAQRLTSQLHTIAAVPSQGRTSACWKSTHVATRSLSSRNPEDNIRDLEKSEVSREAIDGDIVEEILLNLTKKIEEKSKFRIPNMKYVVGLVKILASFKVKSSDIIDCLAERHVEINRLGHELLVDKISYLRTNGFHPAEIAMLLKTRPQILSLKKETMKESLQSYMGIGVPDGRIQLLFAKEPTLFLLTEKEIHRKMLDLGKYFTRKETIEVAKNHPRAFLDSWENIEEKFKYVINVMRLEVKHLKRFEVFEHSIFHIKTRHRFLLKAGLYQTPDKLGTTEIENPSIARVMDTPEKMFVSQVAGLTTEELETFKKMEEMESLLEELEEESDDYDDEADDDDEIHSRSSTNMSQKGDRHY